MKNRLTKLLFLVASTAILTAMIISIASAEIGNTIHIFKGDRYERIEKDPDGWYIYTGNEKDVLDISGSDTYGLWEHDDITNEDYYNKLVLGYVRINSDSNAHVFSKPFEPPSSVGAKGDAMAGRIYELIDCDYTKSTKTLWYQIIYDDLSVGWVSSKKASFYVDTDYLEAEIARQNALKSDSFDISFVSKTEQEEYISLILSLQNNTDQIINGITLNICVIDEDENIIATINPQKPERLRPGKTMSFDVQIDKGLNAYATYVDGFSYQENNGETKQLYYDDVETFYLTDNPPPEKPKIEITFGGTSEKAQTYGGSTSITSDTTINGLIATCPAIATAQKSTEAFYSSKTRYNADFPSGSHAWKITIQNGVYVFNDEKETILLTVAAKGKPSELIPVIKWEIKLLEAIPSIQSRASQLGITLTAEKRVNGGDYASFADSSGVINLLNESKYDGVLEQEHSNLGTLELIDAFSMLGELDTNGNGVIDPEEIYK